MKSIQKILILILVIVLMATSFAACGRSKLSSDVGDEPSASSSEEPSVAPTDAETPTPEASVEPSPEAIPEASTEAPAATPEATNETQVDANQVLGSVNGNTYTNDYFGFSMDLPDGWYVATREEIAQIMQMTADYLKSNADTTIDLTQQTLVPLIFTAPTNPFTNTSGSGNPNIICLAQNIGPAKAMIPDVKSFLNLAVQQVAATGVDTKFGDPEVITVDGQEVGKVTGTTTMGDIETSQTMYVILKGDYVIDFTLSSYSADEAAALESAMSTLSFK